VPGLTTGFKEKNSQQNLNTPDQAIWNLYLCFENILSDIFGEEFGVKSLLLTITRFMPILEKIYVSD